MEKNLLEIRNLNVKFSYANGYINAVRDVSFELNAGRITGIVGESGCGKSVTMRAIIGLTSFTGGKVGENSKILFEDENILEFNKKQWNSYRGNKCSMIFQDAMASLNPTITIGKQLEEPLLVHKICKKAECKNKAKKILDEVKIPNPERCLKLYPHELSGGMRQRVMIAISLITYPKLIIADEPTTSLDVTTQADILKLLEHLQRQRGMSVLLVSHDIGLVSNIVQRIIVMYGGYVVEEGLVGDIINKSKHPYTKALLEAIPKVSDNRRNRLRVISGSPPNLYVENPGCPFAPRCMQCMKICQKKLPPMFRINDEHKVACWLAYDQEKMKG